MLYRYNHMGIAFLSFSTVINIMLKTDQRFRTCFLRCEYRPGGVNTYVCMLRGGGGGEGIHDYIGPWYTIVSVTHTTTAT